MPRSRGPDFREVLQDVESIVQQVVKVQSEIAPLAKDYLPDDAFLPRDAALFQDLLHKGLHVLFIVYQVVLREPQPVSLLPEKLYTEAVDGRDEVTNDPTGAKSGGSGPSSPARPCW